AQIQQHESQRALQEREATARELQQASEVLAREIKGWSPEVAESLRSVAKDLGAKDAELNGIRAPWIVRALHSHKQLMEMQSKASKPPAATPATPVKTVTGMAAKAAPNPDKMSIDEWMAWRNKQAARR
ncbi:MAG: hypothetical protein VKL39_16530, partial [Leptolyngbyaceae bacterium]|nr:hypothetical protein [Leptolyngbyaceae bacterium]